MEVCFMGSTVTIRLNDEEKRIFMEYSKMYKGGLSTMIKQLALEKLQDEYDLQLAAEFERGLSEGTVTVRPYDRLRQEENLK